MSDAPDSNERLFAALKMPKSQEQQPARDLSVGDLRGVIQEGVYRGVMKAGAVYILVSLLVWLVVSLVASSTKYS